MDKETAVREFKTFEKTRAYEKHKDTIKKILAEMTEYLRDTDCSIPFSSQYFSSKFDLLFKELPDYIKPVFECLFDDFGQKMHERGYRKFADILTCQEHGLIGSTAFFKNPYMPIGIGTGKLTIAEAIIARNLEEKVEFCEMSTEYFGLIGPSNENSSKIHEKITEAMKNKYFLLEPLDDNGCTVRDPRVIQLTNSIIGYEIIESTYIENFPYRRPQNDVHQKPFFIALYQTLKHGREECDKSRPVRFGQHAHGLHADEAQVMRSGD